MALLLLILASILLSLSIIGFAVWQAQKLFGSCRKSEKGLIELAGNLTEPKDGQAFRERLQKLSTQPANSLEPQIRTELVSPLLRLCEMPKQQLANRSGWPLDPDYLCDGKRWFRVHQAYEKIQAMPGILTGAGILFTFMGLAVGVYGLDPTDADNLTRGVKRLLGGMSLAFLTSIAGIAAALVWSWQTKATINCFDAAMARLREVLANKAFFLLPETLQVHELAVKDQQLKAWKGLGDIVFTSVSKALETTLKESLRDLLNEQAEAGASSTEKMGQLVQTIRDSLNKMGEQLKDNAVINERVMKLVARSLKDQKESSTTPQLDPQSQERLIQRTSEALVNIGEIGNLQQQLTGMLSEASQELRELMRAARVANSDIIKGHREINERLRQLETHWDQYRTQIHRLQEHIDNGLNQFGDGMQKSLQAVHGEIDILLAESLNHFSATLKDMNTTVTSLSMLNKAPRKNQAE